ncbi:GGDEF domain-containing protein [Shewanella sp. UCD-KL21]|uniref:GGDEF domain-containing protein n=1 Tax=Shewanella sp. UCD-KL21 TaxID=1917164 RepID=UPI00097109B6|nr:GGDEF domain-containing protein [Shewanella sp. UCD-KL21]
MALIEPLVPFDLLAFISADNPLLQFTIDTLPVPIFYKDAKGVYLGCNQAFEAFIKISRQQLVGYSVYQLFDKALADIYQQADQALFDNPGVQIYEKEIRTNSGDVVFVKFHKTSFFDAEGNAAGLIGVIFDITEQKALEAKLTQHATFDDLTGFYNRREGAAIAVENMALAVNGEIEFGVIMLDIDHFKRVNDQFGHGVGDQALQHIAGIIKQLKPAESSVVRWGGEEFLMLIKAPFHTVDDSANATAESDFKRDVITIANQIREAIASTPIILESQQVHLSISCGVSCYTEQSLRALINEADKFLYQAKNNGRNQVCG